MHCNATKETVVFALVILSSSSSSSNTDIDVDILILEYQRSTHIGFSCLLLNVSFNTDHHQGDFYWSKRGGQRYIVTKR